ncbi:hypothetical protein BX600DRAFT_441362 [Xylariales sp. PMI_506]|nr:hypothetical protein BX600DRAFT_441362 [Xylariales sp. PMI_506]
MGRNKTMPPPAKVEDMDEEGNVVEGSHVYARSNIASFPSSPAKQEMNSRKKMSSSRRTGSTSPNVYNHHDSDSTEHPSSSRKDLKVKEKRLSKSGKGKEIVLEKQRPIARTAKTTPTYPRVSDESAFFGVSQTISSSRPRANTGRPQSYYGPHGAPPLSQSAYYAHGPPLGIPTSYPPPQWMGPPPGSSPLASSPMGTPVDYFGRPSDHLASRFARPDHRPQSSMGFRSSSYGHDDYETASTEKHLIRRSSTSKRASKEQEDRVRMPPPARPQTTQPPRVLFKPPAQTAAPRKSLRFDDDDLDGDGQLFRDLAHRKSGEYHVGALPIRSRRQSVSAGTLAGTDYDYGRYALEPASKNRRSTSYAFEDKIKSAAQYQDEVSGGSPANLTAENLRHVKNGGSSHSTRSSASRDESSYRQSATTRTTRSGSGDDDITIKVPSGAVVEVGNAKISCNQGGEINIGRSGGGSDRGTVYNGDLKSRVDKSERPPFRHRASSQSAYSRVAPPQFAPPYHYSPADYQQRAYPPVYPAYPRQQDYHHQWDDDDYD